MGWHSFHTNHHSMDCKSHNHDDDDETSINELPFSLLQLRGFFGCISEWMNACKLQGVIFRVILSPNNFWLLLGLSISQSRTSCIYTTQNTLVEHSNLLRRILTSEGIKDSSVCRALEPWLHGFSFDPHWWQVWLTPWFDCRWSFTLVDPKTSLTFFPRRSAGAQLKCYEFAMEE